MKKVSDVMNEQVITITKDTNIQTILDIMKNNSIGRLPVLDEYKKVVGVVTRDDLLIREGRAPLPPVLAINDLIISFNHSKDFEEKLKKLTGYYAYEVMSTEFLQVKRTDHLEDAVSDILSKDNGYALVIDNGELSGIVTKCDLIKDLD